MRDRLGVPRMRHGDGRGGGPGHDIGGRRARGSLAFAGVTFTLCGLFLRGLAIIGVYLTIAGRAVGDPVDDAASNATLLAFGAPLAASGALLLALPRHPGLAGAADRALVALAVATAAVCAVVTVATGRPMVIAAVGGLGAVGLFRGIVRQFGMR